MPSTKRSPRVEPNGSHDVNRAAAADTHGRRSRRSDGRHAQSAARPAGDARGRFLRPPAARPGRPRRQDRRHLQRHRRRQRADGPAAGTGRRGRRPPGQDPQARAPRPADRRLGRDGRLHQHADRRSAVADHGADPRGVGGGARRPAADRAARGRRAAAQGRVPALRHHRQHHDQAAQRVHLGSDARGARGRHRRQAGRPGAGLGSDRRVEGPDRERQFHGQQPDGAGPQHRGRDHRRRHGRPLQEDHRRRARRDPAAQGSHQHDGGPAALLRLGSDARGARGRHRGQAGRPGAGAGRRRHLEGPDRLRERDVRQPHRPGAQHRAGDHRRGARRPVAQDHRRRARRNPRAQGHHQHDGGPAQLLRLAK